MSFTWTGNLRCSVPLHTVCAELTHSAMALSPFGLLQSTIRGFPGGSVVKNLSAKQEMWVRSLGRDDPLEKEMATTPVFLPGKSRGERSLSSYSPRGHEVGHNLVTKQ